MAEPKHRRKLNEEQFEVLWLLYKFRFGSNDLFARYFGKKDRSFVFKRLKILQEQGLIGKRFDSSYRLKGKPAAYYLLPNGARLLQQAKPGKQINIKAIYKDKTASEEFVEYCLNLFAIYCQLKTEYGESLRFITKPQLINYDYFEDFTPSAYIQFKINDAEKDYFLEYLQSGKPFFAIVKRIKQYIDYAGEGAWEQATSSDFPKVLLVCYSLKLQKRLLDQADNILEDADEELKFYITTKEEFEQSDPELHNLANPSKALSLSQI